jgi:hypothetical protein
MKEAMVWFADGSVLGFTTAYQNLKPKMSVDGKLFELHTFPPPKGTAPTESLGIYIETSEAGELDIRKLS